MTTIDVYPVGVLAALLGLRRAYLDDPDLRLFTDDEVAQARLHAWRRVRREAAATAGRIRRRQWRSLKSAFNGYIAEPTPFPDGLTRCGTGWTRARAERSLYRHGYQRPPITSYNNGQPRYRHDGPCPDGAVDGWGGPIDANPHAPGHLWYECPHPFHRPR